MKIGTDTDKAADILRSGGLVAIPTETVYGLAANALDAEAVIGIFKAKNRPSFDPLIVHLADIDQLEQYITRFPVALKQLAQHFWPGPLTLILPRNERIPDVVCSGLPSAGFRVPKHPLSLELLRKTGFPLAAPSANPFGYVSPTRSSHVLDQLGDKLDYILDGGESPVGVESTIIGVNEEDQPVLYRYGGIPLEEIEAVCGPVLLQVAESSKPNAPGQLDQHYAPHTPLILCHTEAEILQMAENYENCALLCLCIPDDANVPTGIQYIKELSNECNLDEAARNLFAGIRELDKLKPEAIIALKVPDEGLGKAINDRLRRASHC